MTLSIALLVAEEGGGGFNPLDLSHGGGLFWTVVIFLVALLPIWKMVMGPVTRALAERDDKANAAIAAAEKASRDAESSRVAVEAKLREAQTEATKLVDAARLRAESREREIVEEAKKSASALIERARAEIRNEEDKAIAAIRRQVVEVSIHAAGAVLKRKVDAADDHRLVEELVSATGKKAGP